MEQWGQEGHFNHPSIVLLGLELPPCVSWSAVSWGQSLSEQSCEGAELQNINVLKGLGREGCSSRGSWTFIQALRLRAGFQILLHLQLAARQSRNSHIPLPPSLALCTTHSLIRCTYYCYLSPMIALFIPNNEECNSLAVITNWGRKRSLARHYPDQNKMHINTQCKHYPLHEIAQL